MNKILWNAGGIFLIVLNICCFMLAIATNNKFWVVVLAVLTFADWLYKEKRPVWIEV